MELHIGVVSQWLKSRQAFGGEGIPEWAAIACLTSAEQGDQYPIIHPPLCQPSSHPREQTALSPG